MSLPAKSAESSALIDSGAVYTIIVSANLDEIMGFYGIVLVEKCQPFSLVHRFGTNGTPIEPEFGAMIPWIAQDITGMKQEFNLRADVLEGDNPLLIGCPTLNTLQASLDFSEENHRHHKQGTVCDPYWKDRKLYLFKSCPEFFCQGI
jgi:hypothetical protein